MAKLLIAACDLHKKTGLVKWGIDQNQPSHRYEFKNTKAGRRKLIQDLKKLADTHEAGKIAFAYEASGCGFVLYDELTAAGIESWVLAPSKMKRSAKAERNKTDWKDCNAIMEYLRGFYFAGNKLPAVSVPDKQTRDDREITRAHRDLRAKLTKVKLQIKSLLQRNDIERPDSLKKDTFTQKYVAWLRHLCAQKSELPSGAQTVLRSLINQANFHLKELKDSDKAIDELAAQERHSSKVLSLRSKLKGVGIFSALVFLVELGDSNRFTNRRAIGAYFGLAPGSYQSGETDHRGHITKQGSSHVRAVLCQCAWARIRYDVQERALWERLKKKNPNRSKIATVALMRRLAVRMWHVVKEQKRA